MKGAEKWLLIAVRDRLRTVLSLTDQECDIEVDEDAPANVGQRYFAVMPGGFRADSIHPKSGGVRDLVYGVDVLVIRRITNVPRDRTRNVLIGNLGDLTGETDAVIEAIDWGYDNVINQANASLLSEEGSEEGFIKPLIFASVDRRPRIAPAELFGGREETRAGLMRTVNFTGAKRITYV